MAVSLKRDVSPMGASRFEKPFDPKEVLSQSDMPSTTTSPTTPPTSSGNFWSKRTSSRHKPVDSLFSNKTMDTAATSVGSHNPKDEPSVSSPVDVVSPDDWFARFHSDSDLDVARSDDCPDRATLAAVEQIPIYNERNESRTFGSLYQQDESMMHQRQLIIFVRHFYCGACQAYLKAMSESITMQDYFSMRIPTSIIVIGCGEADLIPHYKKFTSCPFPIFADPSRKLFKKLGMIISFDIGKERPEYMKDISPAQWAAGQVKTISKSLKEKDGIRKRDILRGGNPMQIGGEFLFEEGQVVWCHRMRNYRNHAEIKVLRKLLELDDD